MTSGAKETAAHAEEHIGKTAQALSKGLLMGATRKFRCNLISIIQRLWQIDRTVMIH